MMQYIGVIGGGAWGTALANAARRAGRDVILWAREPEVVDAINAMHMNPSFLPGVALDAKIRATGSLAEVAGADAVLLVTPAQHTRAVCTELAKHLAPGTTVAICTKGIENGSGALMSEAVGEAMPEATLAVLSGPTFAAEVARNFPTALTLAAADIELARRLAEALATATFRPYPSDDVIGAQVGGAVKNVMAIAGGIANGRGAGANGSAWLITRGLAEIARLGMALGARRETLMGLSGLGDLVLTCSNEQSRNYSLGLALGRGETLEAYLANRTTVAEGVATAAAVSKLAGRLGVDMPIAAGVDAVLNRGADIDTIVAGLLARPVTPEIG
jgi:glycerol-3-phosphate dehydrogenase (NAD(P)+)